MEKAIEIKRRAQRCIQNGDLDGALSEYEKLVSSEDGDPYNHVLLADLLFKRGDTSNAVQRYLSAVSAYEKAGLYKNAIAVCKKMVRLSLSPAQVLEHLASLHALDGLGTEAGLYYVQHAEFLVREDRPEDAATSLRKAFEANPQEIPVLERLSEVYTLSGDDAGAARSMAEAAHHYAGAGRHAEAERCRTHAEQIQRGAVAEFEVRSAATSTAHRPTEPSSLESFPLDAATPAAPPAMVAPISAPMPLAALEPAESEEATASAPVVEPSGPPPLQVATPLPAAASEAAAPMPLGPIPLGEERADLHRTPAMPESGLHFESPALESAATAEVDDPTAARLTEIEGLIAKAQTQFRIGARGPAEASLLEAARGYESVGRLENAAAIYRSLARSPESSPRLLEIWLSNCEQRDDRREAAEVACELGDRRLQDNDLAGARAWFEKACAFAPDHALARRRLERLLELQPRTESAPPAALQPGWNGAPGPRPAAAEPVPASAAPPEAEQGRVEMAVGRGEAVTFDLGSLLSEFQRGIEAQLSGDAQSHYDLAMAYREMELYDQAVESFRVAAADPAFRQRSAEMIGRCMAALGRHEEAVDELRSALESVDAAGEGLVDLRYQLGLALEAAGRTADALVELEHVAALRPHDADVTHKLNALRNATGQG